MHFETLVNGRGPLRHDPFKALVVPRPIGWISSLSREGQVNLAPYSAFNMVGYDPNIVMFASAGRKDSLNNIEATREFVCNLATYDLREAVVKTSVPVNHGVDEMQLAGLTSAPSLHVKVPRVAESPAALECQYLQTIPVPTLDGSEPQHFMVLGRVVAVYLDDAILTDGKVDIAKLKPLTRLGYLDYGVLEHCFSMPRPKATPDGTGID
ncbi:flavin reductase [Pokkaliibacter plantistimulans]|uniref:Flavin reductase n=1 Tax=Proteobacteria bacterium 228 TaxID=2083153 RepID=A0A2S5KQR5_9PROT|nr:flavin reductase family protein [Pokkaliibacter plantistimulans]PPC77108.1 flavin reductase [Pokkaliibacter plantistimulans]